MTLIPSPPKRKRKVPEYLIREVLNGKPLYYKGFREVLAGKKQKEEIMGCSSLQSVLIGVLFHFMAIRINRKKYWLATNEPGIHAALNNNLSNDIAVYEKEKVAPLTVKYFEVAPKLAIEVDVKVDISDTHESEIEYIIEKSQTLMDFGVERIIWIITKVKKIFVMTPNQNGLLLNFDDDIELMDGIVLNFAQLLEEEELSY